MRVTARVVAVEETDLKDENDPAAAIGAFADHGISLVIADLPPAGLLKAANHSTKQKSPDSVEREAFNEQCALAQIEKQVRMIFAKFWTPLRSPDPMIATLRSYADDLELNEKTRGRGPKLPFAPKK